MGNSPETRKPDRFKVGVMRAARSVDLMEVEVPSPGLGQVLVRIEATAICTWEQRAFTGTQHVNFPFVGGHESAGTIMEIGPGVPAGLAGSRVALGRSSCGACHWCYTGRDRACPSHLRGGVSYADATGPGGFAEYKLHPADAVSNIGDADMAVAALAEPLSCALHAARLLDLPPAADVVVIGAGVMGLLNVIALKQRGARVLVTETSPGRLKRALDFGADEVIDMRDPVGIDTVLRLTEGRGADGVVIAVGGNAANEQAMRIVADRGVVSFFASAHPEVPLGLSPNAIHRRELRIVGSISAEKADFYAAARMIRYKLVDLSPLVEATFPLGDLTTALEVATRPGSYRIIVEPRAS